MNKKFIFIIILLAFSLNINSAHYEAMPLENLESLSRKDNVLSFKHRIFNKSDCSRYLGRSKIIKLGYQPIQISISNNSDRHLMFFLSDFSFECIPSFEVAENVHFNTFNRVIGWTVGGLILWPFFIPAIIEGINSPKANRKLDIDFSKKSLSNQIIQPYSTINGLVFTTNSISFCPDFSFTVKDSETDEIFQLSTQAPIINFQVESEQINNK